MEAITVQQLEDFFSNYEKKCTEYEEATRKKADLYNTLEEMEGKAVEYLTMLDMDKYSSKVGTFTFRFEEVMKVPADPLSKLMFFEYLRSEGIFDQMVSVNSQTLNSWAKKELESHDLNWQIPGLEKGQPRLKVSFRRSK